MRYEVHNEPEHGCCYEAVVLDTYDKSRYGGIAFKIVAECPTKEDAEMIAKALNESASKNS